MDLLFYIKRKPMEVSTEMVHKPDTDDELSRLYDQLLAEQDNTSEDENPQPMLFIGS